ncbi:hypothetical protein COLO4_25308 [Corchorus olitorius]|uniref:TF-B3 domain-containing protein n=1 Tax=Corchorus olitorius TaxID=93759 RepID=A0A1R3I3I0_9ROSI|nr:hypothetical protein COLO4_25308 [Corchorus olitorius]
MALQYGRCNRHSPEPHFFKVVFEDAIREGKLGIPSKFAREYGNTLSSPVFLKVPTGPLWEVELAKCDGKIWLQNGWEKFAQHYSMQHGYFLVFRLEGNSHFHVLIFDRKASEIKYPHANDNEEIQQQEVKIEEESEEDSIQIIDDIPTSRREKPRLQCGRPYKMTRRHSGDRSQRGLMPNSYSSFGKRVRKSTTVYRQLNSYEKSKVFQRAGFKSNNPYFMLVMQSTSVGLAAGGNYCLVSKLSIEKHAKSLSIVFTPT